MKIIWSPQAIVDLHRVAELIATDKKQAALQWAKTVKAKVERLCRFPLSGRIVPEVGREEIREIIVGFYRIIYKVDRVISVLTIFHGSKEAFTPKNKIL